jgi:hypothetical protein
MPMVRRAFEGVCEMQSIRKMVFPQGELKEIPDGKRSIKVDFKRKRISSSQSCGNVGNSFKSFPTPVEKVFTHIDFLFFHRRTFPQQLKSVLLNCFLIQLFVFFKFQYGLVEVFCFKMIEGGKNEES